MLPEFAWQEREDIVSGRLFARAVALAVLGGLAGGPAQGAEAVRGAAVGKTVEYRIMHSKYDEIGSHVLTFSQDGADLVVDVATRIKVKILFITAHSETADRRETWRGGRMVAYSSHTDENGKLFDVTAREEGGMLVIEGPEGRALAVEPVFPTNPWNPEIVNGAVEMDTKTGRLLNVTVAPDGEETVDVAGHALAAAKYRITGELERELWFDAAGNLLQFRFPKDGETLTFTRVTAPE